MKAFLSLLFVATASLVNAVPGDWQKVLESQSKFKNCVMTWAYTWRMEARPKKTPDQIAKAREQFRQQLIAQGLSGSELKDQINLSINMFSDTSAKTIQGYKVFKTSGDVVAVSKYPDKRDKDGGPALETKDALVTEYWNGEDNTRFFANSLEPGAVERKSPNPFPHTGEMAMDLLPLALFRVNGVFGERFLTKVDGNFAYFEMPVPDRDNYVDVGKIDLRTGIPVELLLMEKSISRVNHRCEVTKTKVVDGVTVPSQIHVETLQKDGSIFDSTNYELATAHLNATDETKDIEHMGHVGPTMIDTRLGKGRSMQYRYPGHLPDLSEVDKIGQPFAKPIVQSSGTGAYALSAALIAAGLLIVALRSRGR